MKKVILIPDSFKGTLSSIAVCESMKKIIVKHYPNCNVVEVPIADGGEGTVECFEHALPTKRIIVDTVGPYGEDIKAAYLIFEKTAIIEMAQVAGITLAENRLNPYLTTTYGLGVLIKDAIAKGCNEIIMGLGGSCTNDAGVGMAEALGTVFYDKDGKKISPKSNEFTCVSTIDNSKPKHLLANIKVRAMCDIVNPLYGNQGAAYIFSPQKGATAEMVKVLDVNLMHISKVIKESLHLDVAEVSGAGAAGGLGAGVLAFLGGSLESGIETILDIVHFQEMLEGTDLIFTGEGQIDRQSLHGKVIVGVAKKAKEKNIPVVAVVGSIGDEIEEIYDLGVCSIFSINTKSMDFSESKKHSKQNLEIIMDSILRFHKITK